VVGFGGAETLPNKVQPFISALSVSFAVGGVQKSRCTFGVRRSIWELITRTLELSPGVLDTTVLVVLFREGENIYERAIAKHMASRPFGFQWKNCPNNCRGQFNIKPKTKTNGRVSLQCTLCRWKSRKISYWAGNDHFHQMNGNMPAIFWYEFPPQPSLQNMFF